MPMAGPTPIPVEQRFPLDLDESLSAIRALYEQAKSARWDPFREFDWATLEQANFAQAVKDAARLAYSRRTWQEYTALGETPAVLIRFCLEAGREADPKYFLAVRNTEEAWHIECFSSIANACGGMVAEPRSGAFAAIFEQRRHTTALNAQTNLDAYVATHCAFEDELELRLAEAALANATVPVIRAVLERVVADRRRHAEFGWLYTTHRAGKWNAATRAIVAKTLTRFIGETIGAGYQCVSLAAPGAADELVGAEATIAAAGLGGVPAAQELDVLRATLADARRRFDAWGVAIPAIAHPRTGSL